MHMSPDKMSEVACMAVQFFCNLFSSIHPHNSKRVTSSVLVKVTKDMNEPLIVDYNGLEVKEAVFQIGPDGFLELFFQSYWSTVGEA